MAFDPTQPFEVVDEPPAFDPTQDFERADRIPESAYSRFGIKAIGQPSGPLIDLPDVSPRQVSQAGSVLRAMGRLLPSDPELPPSPAEAQERLQFFREEMDAQERPPTTAQTGVAVGTTKAGKFIEDLTSPIGLAAIAAGGVGGPLVRRGIAALFGGLAASAVPEAARRAGEASVTGNTEEKAQAYTDLAADALFGTAMLGAALKSGIVREVPAIRRWLTKESGDLITPQELQSMGQRINRGEATPQEIARVAQMAEPVMSWIRSNPEVGREIMQRGLWESTLEPRVKSQLLQKYLGVEPGGTGYAVGPLGRVRRPFVRGTAITESEAPYALIERPLSQPERVGANALVAPPREVRQLPAPVSEAGPPPIIGDSAAQGGQVAQPQATPSAVNPVKQVPEPAQFNSVDDLLAFREVRLAEERELYKSQIGIGDDQAKRLQYLLANERSTKKFEADLTPQQRAKMEAFFDGPLNQIGGPFQSWETDRRLDPASIAQETDPELLSSALVTAVVRGVEAKANNDRFLSAVIAGKRLEELGYTKSDVAKYLDRYTTRESGSQADKLEFFKTLGGKVNAFLAVHGINLPEGQLGQPTIKGGESDVQKQKEIQEAGEAATIAGPLVEAQPLTSTPGAAAVEVPVSQISLSADAGKPHAIAASEIKTESPYVRGNYKSYLSSVLSPLEAPANASPLQQFFVGYGNWIRSRLREKFGDVPVPEIERSEIPSEGGRPQPFLQNEANKLAGQAGDVIGGRVESKLNQFLDSVESGLRKNAGATDADFLKFRNKIRETAQMVSNLVSMASPRIGPEVLGFDLGITGKTWKTAHGLVREAVAVIKPSLANPDTIDRLVLEIMGGDAFRSTQRGKPATVSKVRPANTLKSIGIEKPHTLIDDIESIGLKLRLKSKAKAGSKAYYETDDYKSAVTGAARGLFSPTGQAMDTAVQIINSAGIGTFNSPRELLEALTKANATVKNWKSVGHKAAGEIVQEQQKNEAFVEASADNASDPFDNPPSPVASLRVGDKFKIKGEVFTVTDASFDAETGQLAYVRVEDGRQFGVQNLAGAEVIHPDQGEVVPTKKPKLRAGEKQGDLMANVTEDFALAQEQAIDFARVQREKEAAAKSAAEARAIVERDQSKLFGQQDPMLSDLVGWVGKETTGYGAEGVRDMLDDPGTQLSPETRNVLKFLLEKPILGKANWEWLRIELKKEISGGAAGLADHIERSIQMAGGANPETLPHELSHFAYYLLSDLDKGLLDQMRLNELKRLANILKLPSGLIEGVMTSEEFVAAGYMRTAPQLYRFINPREYYAHIIGRRVSELAQEKSRADFLNRNQTTWERFLARILDIAKAIWAAIKSVVKKPVDVAERLVADFLAGKHVPDPSADRARTAPREYALADALKTYDEIKLSDPARADQLLKISQAGTPIGRNLTAQQILADLQSKANPATKPTTVAGRYDRDIAMATLGNPFIADHLARPISNLLDSAARLVGAAQTYRSLKANPSSTPSEISAASGYALDELNTFLNDHELLTSDGPAKRTALLAELSEAIQKESDSIIERDVARVLFEDFKDIGVELFEQKGDVEGRAAYQDALGTRIPTMRVLRSITAYVDMTPVRAGTITTVDQLYQHMGAEVQAKATWNNDLPTTIGAMRDVIRNTLRIVLASERLRDDIDQSKRVIANKAALQPTTKAIADIHQAVRTGNIDQAFTVFTRGVVAAGVDQRDAQDAVEFWAKRTRRRVVAIQSLDKVMGIADTMRNDPSLMGEMRDVFDDLGVKDILYDQTGSGVRFKARALGEPEVEVPFDNERTNIEETVANLKAFEQRLIGELATETDPRRANGIRWALDRIKGYLNPSVNPATSRFLQSGPLVALQTIFGAMGHVDMIPKYVLEGGGGFAASNAHLTRVARATIEEVIQGLMRRHEEPIKRTAAKALSSHGPKMLPMAYQRKILNPLAASRQNFADTRVLKMGDPIGNGHFVTKEDLAYVLAWENFERDLMASVNGTAKENLSSLRSVYAGILFDNQGRVRLPYATGPDTLTRHFPPGLKNWISSWKNNAAGREAMIDSEPDRLLLGYVDGVSRSDWEHTYAYVDELKDILRNVRTVPVSTLDKLAREIHARRILIPGNQESLANVKDNLLAEFGAIFDKLDKYDRDNQPKDLKSSIDVFGGDNSYNTERSHLVMPPGWYDYAGITAADRASHARAATWPFAEAHIAAVDALANSLEGIVGKMKRRIEDVGQETVRKETKEAMRRGDLIYDLEQAKRVARQFRAYHGKLTNIRDLPELLISSDQPAAVVTSAAWQVILASLLAPAKSVAKNLWGGVMWATIDDMLLRDQNFFIAFPKNTAKTVATAYRGLLATVANDHTKTGRAMLAILNTAENIVFVEHVAKFFLDSIKKHRELFGHTREIGSNMNEADILANLDAMWGFRHMSGDIRQLPPGTAAGRVAATVQTMARQYARFIGHFTVQAGDAFLNAKGIEKARLDEQHLKNIARRYGPILVALANKAGRNPWDSTNPLNNFPKKALGGEWRGRYKRKFFSQDAALDFDAMLLEYYRKWTEARAMEAREGKPEGFYSNDVPIFSREQFNQLAMAHSKYMNQAAFDNRLVSARTSKTAALASTFLGYMANQTYEFLSFMNRSSRKGWTKGRLENLPWLVNVAIAVAIMSVIGRELYELIKRITEDKRSGFPMFVEVQNPNEAFRVIASSVADQVSVYGTAVNLALGMGYRTGFDPNQSILALNLINDIAETGRKAWQTQDPGSAAKDFAMRWTWPLNVVGGRLPSQSGLREMRNMQNDLMVGAQNAGIETKRRGGGGERWNYTPLSPILAQAVNAIGKGDMTAFQEAFSKAVEYERSKGSDDPEKAALRAIQARNPVSRVFGSKPTQGEMDRIMAGIPDNRRPYVQEQMANWDQAIQSVGGGPVAFVKQAPGSQAGAAAVAPTGGRPTRQAAVGMPALPMPVAGSRFGIRRVGARLPTLRRSVRLPRQRGIRRPRIRSLRPARLRLAGVRRPRATRVRLA